MKRAKPNPLQQRWDEIPPTFRKGLKPNQAGVFEALTRYNAALIAERDVTIAESTALRGDLMFVRDRAKTFLDRMGAPDGFKEIYDVAVNGLDREKSQPFKIVEILRAELLNFITLVAQGSIGKTRDLANNLLIKHGRQRVLGLDPIGDALTRH